MGFYEVMLSSGHLHEVELVPSGHTWKAEVDGHEMTIRLLGASRDEGLLVDIDGTQHRVPLRPQEDDSLHDAIEHVSVSVPLLPQRKAPGQDKAPQTSVDINSSISGVVLTLHVEEGEYVAEGQPLLVMEAMKMENVLCASQAGKVHSIPFAPGDTVRKGERLLSIDTTPSEIKPTNILKRNGKPAR